MQYSERRRPGGAQAPADHLRVRSRQPAALPQVRQDGAAPSPTLLQLAWQPRHARVEVYVAITAGIIDRRLPDQRADARGANGNRLPRCPLSRTTTCSRARASRAIGGAAAAGDSRCRLGARAQPPADVVAGDHEIGPLLINSPNGKMDVRVVRVPVIDSYPNRVSPSNFRLSLRDVLMRRYH